jgi:dTMP kinase
MAGKFIVFEGIDGSGKGTMLAMTAEWIFKNKPYDKILMTREPTYSAVGRQIRKMLREGIDPNTKGKQLFQYYLEDRKEHLEKVVKPAIRLNAIVLCDRYKYSTFAYQRAQGIPIDVIKRLHERMLVPDLTIILDIEPQLALERIRKERNMLEKFEKPAFMEELRENYLKMKEILPEENIVIIDASGSVEEVFAAVKYHVGKVLE